MTNLHNSKDVKFELLISNFSDFRDIKELKANLSRMQNSYPIHVWENDPGLPESANQLIREVFIQGLEVDEILIVDLFESRHHIPISIKKYFDTPTSVILYDLIPLEDPETYLSNSHSNQVYQNTLSDLVRADRIFCISQYTLDTLVKNFELLKSKAVFIGGAANSDFTSRESHEKVQLIAVLGDDPRKNVSNLTSTWANMPAEVLEKYTLKIVGKFSPERISFYLDACGISEAYKEKLIFTGEISDQDLEFELNSSIALVHPALSEGLGLPILEAITLGIPAICSNTTSMTEIGASGAIFDPNDTSSLQKAILKIIQDVAFQNEVILSQRKILELFNWDHVCKVLLDAFASVTTFPITKSLKNPRNSKKVSSKIAVIGPSKFAKTGIARFVEFLMPFMQSEASVKFIPTESLGDLETSIKILDKFDQVLIHLGNSPHHENAFNLAANYPAIVFCHDVKFGHTLRNLHRLNSNWMPELAEVSELEQEQLEIRSLVRIFNLTLGVVVQSESARDFLYQVGIPNAKMLCLTIPYLQNEKFAEKVILPAADLDQILSAGFVTPNKIYEEIIEGISILNDRLNKSYKLKLLGEADFDYSTRLKTLAEDKAVDLEITGYMKNDEYLGNLKDSALAIQLRSLDSGEASGVISDLLFFGVPTIVNQIGSLNSLPDSAVVKLPTKPTALDVANAIHQTLDHTVRTDLSKGAQEFSVMNSSPEFWSRELINFMSSRYKTDLLHNGRRNSKMLHKADILKFSEICKSMEKKNKDFGHKYLIASDVTTLKSTKFVSGIQRATLQIHDSLSAELPSNRFLLGPVDFGLGESQEKTTHTQIRNDIVVSGSYHDPYNIDALLLIDLNFNFFKSSDFTNITDRNIPVITNVYDVLPISNPEWFPVGTAENLFVPWIISALKYSSDIIVNSKATLAELKKLEQFPSFNGQVHVAPLGIPNDFQRVKAERKQFQTLIVGTVEPRKGHEDALNAFDELHARGVSVELHIVGRQGWMVEDIIERITNHFLYNEKLFWHSNCSDEELNELYGTSQITLITSKGEGFGLPLVEAMSQGSTVIARDIPVFREIAQQGVIFFDSKAGNLVEVWMHALNQTGEVKSDSLIRNNGYVEYARVLKSILVQKLEW